MITLTSPHSKFRALIASIFASVSLIAVAHAETTSSSGATAVTTAPVTLSAAGTYYLANDLSVNIANGNGILITASNVTLDLNGHTLTNTYGAATTSMGIRSSGYANITVRNGTITGFYYGLRLTGTSGTTTSASYGHLLERLNVVNNLGVAVSIQGVYCRVYQCRTVLTGGSSGTSNYYSFLFDGQSNANCVEDCDVCGQTGTGTFYGIGFTSGADNFAINNRISGVTKGIYCAASIGLKYRDNLTSSVTTPYTGGTDAGNNN